MQSPTNKQDDAIKHFHGPALVIAGPGAGKTYVVTERVKNLLQKHKINSESMLITTFTEKAATELKVRLAREIGKEAEMMQISTIHSFCKAMLEKYFMYHEYGAEIDVLDNESQNIFIRHHDVNFGLAYWENNRKKTVKVGWDFYNKVLSFYSKMTANQIDPEALIRELKKQKQLQSGDEEIILSYLQYQTKLHDDRMMDFDMLQTRFYSLLQKKQEVLNQLLETFQYIMIDEYQDTSPLQDRIFKLLAGKNKNLFVVGDEDQSIYGFRGASIRNFTEFLKRYPNAKKYLLDVNFRSTETIVNFSKKVFEHGIKKEIEARRRTGEKIRILTGETTLDAAEKAVAMIKKMKSDSVIKNYGDVALLFRSIKNHGQEYITELNRQGIPFVTYGDGSFFKREEINTMLYMLSYVDMSFDKPPDFSKKWGDWWKKDQFYTEFFGFSDSTIKTIQNATFNLRDLRTQKEFQNVGFTERSDIEKLVKLNHIKDEVEGDAKVKQRLQRPKFSLLELYYRILDASGYFQRLIDNQTTDNMEKLYNLAKLSSLIRTYMNMTGEQKSKNFFWYLYNRNNDIDQDKLESGHTVKLMTVHKAKGMEFPVVFVCSMNKDRFPLTYKGDMINIPSKFLDSGAIDPGEEHAHEERRLFYVALTRAQDNLVFTTSNKIKSGKSGPSPFLSLVSDDFTDNQPFKLASETQYSVSKAVPNLNYSAINTLIDCPLRYQLVYDYGFETPSVFMQDIGTFLHNALQHIHIRMQRGKNISPAELKQIIDRCWIDLHSKDNDAIRAKYEKKVVDYYLKIKTEYKEILAIEESFSHIDDNMIIKGRVDLIVRRKDDKVMLVDFKARSGKGLEKTNISEQLRIYDYCLGKQYKIDILAAHTLDDNTVTEFDKDPKKIESLLKTMSKEMKQSSFQPQKGDFCPMCQFSFYCTAKGVL